METEVFDTCQKVARRANIARYRYKILLLFTKTIQHLVFCWGPPRLLHSDPIFSDAGGR